MLELLCHDGEPLPQVPTQACSDLIKHTWAQRQTEPQMRPNWSDWFVSRTDLVSELWQIWLMSDKHPFQEFCSMRIHTLVQGGCRITCKIPPRGLSADQMKHRWCKSTGMTLLVHHFDFLKVLHITSAARCTESHDYVLFPQLDRNMATAFTAVSARTIWCGFLDARLITRCNTDLYTPSHAQCSISQSMFFLSFPKYSSSQLQPGALTLIESHDCVSFSQLDRNSASGLALSLHATCDADLWMQGSLLASMQTCTPPPMPVPEFHNHKN